MRKKNDDNRRLTIAAVGDISLGDHPVCVGHGMRKAFEKKGHQILKNVKHYLQDADVVIGNLETVASDAGLNRFSLQSYEMRGRPAHLDYLKDAGFNVLGVANNHAMQHGRRAFQNTVEHLKRLDISVIGIDDDHGRTIYRQVAGPGRAKSIIFSASARPEEWTDAIVPYSLRLNEEELLDEVKELRNICDGFLICSIHWGLEFLDMPGPEQISLGHNLIDAGVDVLFGHHPHVLQPVEEYNGGLIFYSLGNFTFDLWPLSTKYSVIATVKFEKNKLPKYICTPVLIGESYTVTPANEPHYSTIRKKISNDRMTEHKNNLSPREYYQNYMAARLDFRYSSYKYFLKKIHKYPLHFLIQSFGRTVIRRLFGL